MKAEYILELVEAKKSEILALLTVQDRINKVIEIAKSAPVPSGTPVGFEFVETMNVESGYLIEALKMYEKAGRVVIAPNQFSKTEADNVSSVLCRIYELCEKEVQL